MNLCTSCACLLNLSPCCFREIFFINVSFCLFSICRLSRGRDAGGWFHKHFLRGEPDEIDNIIRVKIKSKAAIESSNDLDEEEFYAMPPLSAPASAMHGDTYSISRMINCSVPSQPPEGQCDSPCHVGSGSANLSLSRQVLNAPAEQSALALYQQAPSQVLSLPPNFMTEGYRRFVSDTHNAVVANDCHSQYAPADMHTHLVSPVDSPNHQRRVFQGDVDGFEPLPFEEDSLSDSIERDEFSHFIDSVIPNL